MFLAIDAGNTNISFAVFHGRDVVASWRCASERHRTADDYAVWLMMLFQLKNIQFQDIKGIVIASVVPEADFALGKLARQYFHQDPLFALASTVGLPVDVPEPAEVGADRLINALAAKVLYGAPAIVIDFGTATTFDVLDMGGAYVGGIIAPGLQLSLEALYNAAAKLPRIAVQKPEKIVGNSTVKAMQSGVYWGYIGMIESLLQRIRMEYFEGETEIHVISTGGLGALFAGHFGQQVTYDDDLTLKGLQVVFERQQRGFLAA